MPKVIQPRRHDKSLSAEQFWNIKLQQKTVQPPKPQVQPHQEEKVLRRHRFQKTKDLATVFDPLSYFLKPIAEQPYKQLTMVQEDEETFVGNYMQNVRGQISSALIEFKKMSLSRKLINHNHKQLYSILLSHLELEDSWPLLVALTQDSKPSGIGIWLEEGFSQLSLSIERLVKLNFNNTVFSHLFKTLCVVVDTHFEEIAERLRQFFEVFSSNFLRHRNKYIRQFSLQVFSYLLSNLPEEHSSDFISFLVHLRVEGFFDEQLSLGRLLAEGLKVVKGCLTTSSLARTLNQLKDFAQILTGEHNTKSLQELGAEYVLGVLIRLNNRFGARSDQVIFDFKYFVTALIQLSQQQPLVYSPILLLAFSDFLCLYQTQPRKFEARTSEEEIYLQQIWDLFAQFFMEHAPELCEADASDWALSLLSLKSRRKVYFNKDVLKYFQSRSAAVAILIKLSFSQQCPLPQKLLELMSLLCKDFLLNFWKKGDGSELVYELLLLIKRNQFSKLFEGSFLDLSEDAIVAKLRQAKVEDQLLVALRLLCFVNLRVTPSLTTAFLAIKHQRMRPLTQALSSYSQPKHFQWEGASPECFYKGELLSRQMILFSQHEIPWLSHYLNLMEAFLLLETHLKQLSSQEVRIEPSPAWAKLIVSRKISVSFLQGSEEELQVDTILQLAGSRVRDVRLFSLSLAKRTLFPKYSEDHPLKAILSTLMQIDEGEINLDNERNVKMKIQKLQLLLELALQQASHQQFVLQLLLQWSLGFAFTGFQLIEPPFVHFLSRLLDTNSSRLAEVLLPFLRYYNYRHSRQYDVDQLQDQPTPSIARKTSTCTHPAILPLAQEDFALEAVDTVEWIGLERIAKAVHSSKNFKKHCSQPLLQLVQSYFSVEFQRAYSIVSSFDGQPAKGSLEELKASPLLLPIKSRFLAVILRLCPSELMPPPQCLHFLRKEYFQQQRVREIKRSGWELLWEGKKKEATRARDAQKVGNNVNFSSLSAEESELYLNYLWKEMLECNHNRKRVILEHIRNELPSSANLFFGIFSHCAFLTDLPHSPEAVALLSHRLSLLNRKVLLNLMFIAKAIIATLKAEAAQHIPSLLLFVLAIFSLCYPTLPPSEEFEVVPNQPYQGESGSEGEERKEGEDEMRDSSEDEMQDSGEEQRMRGKGSLYKQHRKELQKLLHTLFSSHQLQPSEVGSLIEVLSNAKINLKSACRFSVPGILPLLDLLTSSKDYCILLLQPSNSDLLQRLTSMLTVDSLGRRPLPACSQLWISIFSNLLLPPSQPMQDEDQELQQVQLQEQIDALMQPHIPSCLQAVLFLLTDAADDSKKKGKKSERRIRVLSLGERLFELNSNEVNPKWGDFILTTLAKTAKEKPSFDDQQLRQLHLLLTILPRCLVQAPNQNDHSAFLGRILALLPLLKDPSHRCQIAKVLSSAQAQLQLGPKVTALVRQSAEVSQVGLQVGINFSSFFASTNAYSKEPGQFLLAEHQFFLFNLLGFIDHEELSVRRAVLQCNTSFLQHCDSLLQSPSADHRAVLGVAAKIVRVLVDSLGRSTLHQGQSLFWSILEQAEVYTSWFYQQSSFLSQMFPGLSVDPYRWLGEPTSEGQSCLKMLCSLSDSHKLKAIKGIQGVLSAIGEEEKVEIAQSSQELPSPLHRILLPVLEYLILHPTEENLNSNAPKSNLASSLSLVSLELLPTLSGLLPHSAIKKNLKRWVSRVKAADLHSKKCMALVKMIGQVVEGLSASKLAPQLESFISQHGFEAFHYKVSTASRQEQQPEESEEEEQPSKPSKRVSDFYDHLQELESEEAINRNFMSFDKKLMEAEDQGTPDFDGLSGFLRRHILPPLRSMLMSESRTAEQDDASRGKLLLSVATIKIIQRLPLDLFLSEFQKIVAKLSRFLKRSSLEARENARSCLCEVAKAVGPHLLYSILLAMRASLRDTFDGHVLNFTVFRLLESMHLQTGQLDYCLPLLLPPTVDEVFGKSSQEKELIERGQAPTIKLEAKKKKGLQLLQRVCRFVSAPKLTYIIEFLEKSLAEHLVSEQNLGKYEQMLAAISAGFSNNTTITNPESVPFLLPALASPISKLRSQLKLLNDSEKGHQNSLVKKWAVQKAEKRETLRLQEEAGRNGSIFGRVQKEAAQKRHSQVQSSCLAQFYLAVLSLLAKRQVLSLHSMSCNPELALQMSPLLDFLIDCIDHRDNRLAAKGLKILHLILTWKESQLEQAGRAFADKLKSSRRQANRKVLLLVEHLTLADQDLLKDCFSFLNDLVGSVAVGKDLLATLVAVIKLHSPATDQQPHIPQTYQLLRTILLKNPEVLYHPLLKDLHQMVQLQLVNSHNPDISRLCQQILSLYLRSRQHLQPAILALRQQPKGQGQRIQTFEVLIREEITFHLSNLQSSAQEAIIELLSDLVSSLQRQDLEKYSELMLLSLMTARTNAARSSAELNGSLADTSPFDPLLAAIISKTDQGKVSGLLQKCFSWMKQGRHSNIRLCGTAFLRVIASQKLKKSGKGRVIREELAEGIKLVQAMLEEEVVAFEEHLSQKGGGKVSKQWNQIINNLDASSEGYSLDLAVFEAVLLLREINLEEQIQTKGIEVMVGCGWKLLLSKNQQLVEATLAFIQQQPVLLQVLQQPQESPFSVKRVFGSLLFEGAPLEPVEQLMQKILEEEEHLAHENTCLASLVWLLVGLSLKAHLRPKEYQAVLPRILRLIHTVLLSAHHLPAAWSLTNLPSKLIEMTVKLTSNTLVQHQSKSLVAAITERLKEHMGASQYFAASRDFEEKRRRQREEAKTKQAEMAITDPQQFASSKSKRRKLQ